MNPDSLGAVNKRVTTEVLRKRKAEPNLSESDSEYSTDNSSRSKRKYGGNLFIFIFFLGGAPTSISSFFCPSVRLSGCVSQLFQLLIIGCFTPYKTYKISQSFHFASNCPTEPKVQI